MRTGQPYGAARQSEKPDERQSEQWTDYGRNQGQRHGNRAAGKQPELRLQPATERHLLREVSHRAGRRTDWLHRRASNQCREHGRLQHYPSNQRLLLHNPEVNP